MLESFGAKSSSLTESVDDLNKKFDLPTGGTGTSTSTASADVPASAGPARTLCRPTFTETDKPHDFTQPFLPDVVLDVASFDADKESLANKPHCSCLFMRFG